MKTYAEWLEEFRTKINEGYRKHRMDKKLAGSVYDVERKTNIMPKGSGPIGAFDLTEGRPPPLYTFTTQNVTPLNIGFQIDMKEWAKEPERYGMDTYMEEIGETIAEREAYAIIKGMLDNAGHSIKAKTKEQMSKEDIIEAKNWIRSQGFYADTIILQSEQETQFLLEGALLEPHLIPTSYVSEEDRGHHYLGRIDGLNVYWAKFVGGLAIVYSKRSIKLAKTPLKIEFDNLERPSKLTVERWCSSAPMDKRGVVKIDL